MVHQRGIRSLWAGGLWTFSSLWVGDFFRYKLQSTQSPNILAETVLPNILTHPINLISTGVR